MLDKISNSLLRLGGILLIVVGCLLIWRGFHPKKLHCDTSYRCTITDDISIVIGTGCKEIK